jgi:hypothetical protein
MVATVDGAMRLDEPVATVVRDVLGHGFVGIQPDLGEAA